LLERPLANSPCDCIGTGLQALAWFADFGSQFLEVPGRLIKCVLTFELGPKRDLQQFGCWKAAPLQLIMQFVGQIDLKPGHTPNYTPTDRGVQGTLSPSKGASYSEGQVLDLVRPVRTIAALRWEKVLRLNPETF